MTREIPESHPLHRLFRGIDYSFQLGFQAHSATGTSVMVTERARPSRAADRCNSRPESDSGAAKRGARIADAPFRSKADWLLIAEGTEQGKQQP